MCRRKLVRAITLYTRYGIPSKLIRLTKATMQNTLYNIIIKNTLSEPFNGHKNIQIHDLPRQVFTTRLDLSKLIRPSFYSFSRSGGVDFLSIIQRFNMLVRPTIPDSKTILMFKISFVDTMVGWTSSKT